MEVSDDGIGHLARETSLHNSTLENPSPLLKKNKIKEHWRLSRHDLRTRITHPMGWWVRSYWLI